MFSRFGSETQFRKVRVAVGEIRDSVLGFIVFDEEMIDAGVFGGGRRTFQLITPPPMAVKFFGDLVIISLEALLGSIGGILLRSLRGPARTGRDIS